MSKYRQWWQKVRDSYLEQTRGFQLGTVIESSRVCSYRIQETPSTRWLGTQITETEEGLVLQGDFCPTRRGICSRRGYNIAWFCGAADPFYLAEKFLQPQFDSLWAAEFLESTELSAAQRERAQRAIEAGLKESVFRDICEQSELRPRYSYRADDLGLLSGIQQRFAQLWEVRYVESA